MKIISETTGIERLGNSVSGLANEVAEGYEHRALDCARCDDRGKCCRDEHFVNVRVTRLEAAAIKKVVDELPTRQKDEVYKRAERAIETYQLDKADNIIRGYACPLLDKDARCLVHGKAKPMPCVLHACYEDPNDLPPASMITQHEMIVARLNRIVYGGDNLPLPIPLAISRTRKP